MAKHKTWRREVQGTDLYRHFVVLVPREQFSILTVAARQPMAAKRHGVRVPVRITNKQM